VSIFGVAGTYEGGSGGNKLYVFCGQGYTGAVDVAIAGTSLGPRYAYDSNSLVAGSTVSITTYNPWILNSITGEDSGTTYDYTTITRGQYTFTMPNESVYCAMDYDD